MSHKCTPLELCFQVVACGSVIIERKFVRNAGLVGHIEDIAVSQSMQGRKLGMKIINTLVDIGLARGCYKIILDCSEKNIRGSTITFALSYV